VEGQARQGWEGRAGQGRAGQGRAGGRAGEEQGRADKKRVEGGVCDPKATSRLAHLSAPSPSPGQAPSPSPAHPHSLSPLAPSPHRGRRPSPQAAVLSPLASRRRHVGLAARRRAGPPGRRNRLCGAATPAAPSPARARELWGPGLDGPGLDRPGLDGPGWVSGFLWFWQILGITQLAGYAICCGTVCSAAQCSAVQCSAAQCSAVRVGAAVS
jgi:hypothetical protein